MNVSVSTSASDRFKWVNGQANISWAPVVGAVDYRVVVDPLYNGYTESFAVSADAPGAAINSTFQDFVIETGKPSNAVRVVNDVLRITLDDWSWTNVTASFSSAPLAFRRIPESIPTAGSNAFIQVDVDCSGAPNISDVPSSTNAAVMCGIIVQNAANRIPLLFWGLKRTNAVGATWQLVMDGIRENVYVFPNAGVGRPWPASGVRLYLERAIPTATTLPFVLAAKLASDATPWASVTPARQTVASSTLDAFLAGALWFGVGAKAAASTAAAFNTTLPAWTSLGSRTGAAVFDNLVVGMTMPTAWPRDIYGFTDVCAAGAGTRPLPVVTMMNTSSRTSLILTSLSANYPYTVTVFAIGPGNVTSPPSPPLEGIYFWARQLPPRQQKLRFYLDSYWPSSGGVTNMPDASGFAHHVINTAANTAQRPTMQRGGGYASNFARPGFLRFTRTSSTYLAGDADSYHLSADQPMTVYWFARTRGTASQILLGRGMLATRLSSTDAGWAFAISSLSTDTMTGFLSMRVGSYVSPQQYDIDTSLSRINVAAAQTRSVVTNAGNTYQTAFAFSGHISRVPLNTSAGAPDPWARLVNISADPTRARWVPRDYNFSVYPTIGAMGLHRVTACNQPACSTGQEGPFFDERNRNFRNTYFSDPFSVEYRPWTQIATPFNATPFALAPRLVSVPPQVQTSPLDNLFRVGGQPYGSNPLTAYEGDIYAALIYNEDHDTATRNEVINYLFDRYERNYCTMSIAHPTTTSAGVGQCISGSTWSDCFQDCTGGNSAYFGNSGFHYCQNGYWSTPGLVCRRMCNDVLAPIYYATCWRRFLDERFNLTADPNLHMLHWVFPPDILNVERSRIFTVDPAATVLVADTRQANPCERIRANTWFLYGPHPTRWQFFMPPANKLGQTTRAAISLADAASTAGIYIRMTDQNNHYRLETTLAQVQLVRLVGGGRTIIGSFRYNRTHAPNEWFILALRGIATTNDFEVWYGPEANATMLGRIREPQYWNSWGSGGVIIAPASTARFDNLTVDIECDLGGAARYMYSGMQLFYTCKFGYKTIGNTTWTCGDQTTQYGGANLICLSDPPIPQVRDLMVMERSPNGTFVGAAIAIPANGDQVLSYEILAQFPPCACRRFAFSVTGCSGTIRVYDPAQLDYYKNPNITITLFAWPDTQKIAGIAYNVTVGLIHLPSPPSLEDQQITIPEGGCGPGFYNFTLPVSNPDNLRLSFRIESGNRDGMFALNSTTGVLTVSCAARRCPFPIAPAQCPPGLQWAYKTDYALSVFVAASDGGGGSATVSISVIDVNSPPLVIGGTFPLEVFEQDAKPGGYVGFVGSTDMDSLNPANLDNNATTPWFRLSYGLVSNAIWTTANGSTTFTDLLNLTADGMVSMASSLPPAGLPFDRFFFFNRRLVRAVLSATFFVRDGGGLNSSATLQVLVLSANETGSFPTITGINFDVPAGQVGLSTLGGELISFTGTKFPQNAPLDVRFFTPDRVLRVATRCFITTDTLASCRAPAGFGYALKMNVTMGNRPPNSTVPLEVFYSPPRVEAAFVNNPAGLSTAGSASGAITILGSNLGPPGAVVTIRLGGNGLSLANAPFDMFAVTVAHSRINATLGPGCGMDLPIVVSVGGQESTAAWLDFAKATWGSGTDIIGYDEDGNPITSTTVPWVYFSYPQATISSFLVPAGLGYRIDSLSTMGRQALRLKGDNFGPAAVRGTARRISVVYTDASNTFSYRMTCSPSADAPHTDMDCSTAPGVGAGHTFVAAICGQPSLPSSFNASYAPPLLEDLAGSGAFRASTEGGQRVILRGRNFGPVTRVGDTPQPVTGVFYGREEAGQPVYRAADCYVATANEDGVPSDIYCLTAPGTGDKLVYRVSVGFQMSAPLDRGASYGAPVVSFFTGLGAVDADTRAGPDYVVTVNGLNFGPDFSLISVLYRARLSIPRASDGLLPSSPGAAPGVVEFRPDRCWMNPGQEHRAFNCILQPGAGANLLWKVTVDRQASTDPTTSFGRPTITGVRLANTALAYASTDGGDLVNITGYNFGLAFLVQAVTYGPSGTEYAVRSWTYRSHTLIQAVLAAGVGTNLSFVVTVADQPALPFRSPVGYAGPRVVSITPSTYGTAVDALHQTVITVRGYDFGLLNPNVEVEIAMGNYADQSMRRLPVVARTPTLAEVNDPDWAPPPAPFLQTVSFYLPEGLAPNRTIRLIQYLRGRKLTDAQLLRLDPQGVPNQAANQFHYGSPFLSFIVVRTITDDATCTSLKNAFLQACVAAGYPLDQLLTPPPTAPPLPPECYEALASGSGDGAPVDNSDPTAIGPPVDPSFNPNCTDLSYLYAGLQPTFDLVNCSSGRVVELIGFNLGPPSSRTGDAIQRLIQWKDTSSGSGSGSTTWLPAPRPFITDPSAGGGSSSGASGNDTRVAVNVPLVAVTNYSHTRIIAYTSAPAGTLRLNVAAALWDGSLVSTVSNELPFAETSPLISFVGGQVTGGFAPEGYSKLLPSGAQPQLLTVTVSELLQFRTLRILVGEALTQALCPIIDPNNPSQPVAETDVYRLLVEPVTRGSAAPVTLYCMVPEGQGGRQPVVVVRDSTTSNTDFTIDYAPPRMIASGVVVPAPPSVPADATVMPDGVAVIPYTAKNNVTVPTTMARMRLLARNAGPCPAIRIRNGAGSTLIESCRLVPDVLLGRKRVLTGDVALGFDFGTRLYSMEFNVTDGEGTGVTPADPIGWSITIEAGNQDTASSGGIIKLRYLPPVVYAISPSGGPTTGSSAGAPYPLVLTGANFGTGTAAGIRVQLVSPYRTNPLTCASVNWLSHFAIQCLLPVGSGYHLRARVTVAGQTGEGAAFNYSAPAISRITVFAPDLLLDALRPGAVPWKFRTILNASDPTGNSTVTIRSFSGDVAVPAYEGVAAGLATIPIAVWQQLPVNKSDLDATAAASYLALQASSGSGSVPSASWGEIMWRSAPGSSVASMPNASAASLSGAIAGHVAISNATPADLTEAMNPSLGAGPFFALDMLAGRRLLHWRASGGAVVVVDGSNFGAGGTRDDCVLVSPRESVSPGPALSDSLMRLVARAANNGTQPDESVVPLVNQPAVLAYTAWLGVPRCNGFEDFLGEGELPPSSLLFWSHSRVVFLLPPGAGYRTITVAAGSQPPLQWDAAMAAAQALPNASVGITSVAASLFNFRYIPPRLAVPLVRRSGKLTTDGGDIVEALGFSFPFASTALGRDPAATPLVLPPSTVSFATILSAAAAAAAAVNGTVVQQGRSAGYYGDGTLPFALPSPAFSIMPWDNVRITIGNSSANGTCLASPGPLSFGGSGNRPPGFERCALGKIVVQAPSGSTSNPYTNRAYRRILIEQQAAQQQAAAAAQTTAAAGTEASNDAAATAASTAAALSGYAGFLTAFNEEAVGYVDLLSFAMPPGVGVNKSLTIEVVDGTGTVVAASDPTFISYDKPIIDKVISASGSRIIYDDGNGGDAIRITGRNMGRFRDVAFYSPDEQLLEVSIGGWLAVNATRQESIARNAEGVLITTDYVGFTLPRNSPVGFSEILMRVAGQMAESSTRSSASLFIGCKFGFFAHSNESCALCPEGANCTGLAGAMLTYPNGRTELDVDFNSPVPVPHPYLKEPGSKTTPLDLRRLLNGTIMVGDVEVDRLGYHTYPVPASGFFNLNSTMRSACPEKVFNYFPARDVCIVACIPAFACEGANICNEAYISKSPYFRCSSCAPGYYRSAGDCIKCPDNPGMVFVGFGMVILTVAGLGYYLNKYNYDTRVVAVGIDYFQVLAIFANAKVAWPPQIKELFRILSAFNLNLEIVAPECLVPDVSFEQKYFVVLMLPFVILFIFFLIAIARFMCARYCKGQKDWKGHIKNIAGSVSILMLMLFLIYLYFCKTVLSPFECQPATPDDGKTYMQAVFEECGKPGGVQMRLVPWSVFAILLVVFGYPAFVFAVLWYNKETVMEDQLLRALNLLPPKEDWTSTIRAMMARTYYQFKPRYYLWTITIIGRKFFIAFSSLMFSRNPAFQMAFCLLILFLAFSSQVRFSPYMPVGDFDIVLEEAAHRAMKGEQPWARLKDRLASVEKRQRKAKNFNNKLDGRLEGGVQGSLFKSKGAMRVVVFMTDYNTVDAFLLFSASMVCLLGIMYQTLQSKVSGAEEGYYKDTRFSITVGLMLLISVSITYYVAVLILDFMSQSAERKAKAASAKSALAQEARDKKRKKTAADEANRGASAEMARVDKFFGLTSAAKETVANPMFTSGSLSAALGVKKRSGPGGKGVLDAISDAILVLEAQEETPPQGVWAMLRDNTASAMLQTENLGEMLASLRDQERRMIDALRDLGLVDEDGRLLEGAAAALGHKRRGRGTVAQFGPVRSANKDGDTDEKTEEQIAAVLAATLGGSRSSGGGGGPRASLAVRKMKADFGGAVAPKKLNNLAAAPGSDAPAASPASATAASSSSGGAAASNLAAFRGPRLRAAKRGNGMLGAGASAAAASSSAGGADGDRADEDEDDASAAAGRSQYRANPVSGASASDASPSSGGAAGAARQSMFGGAKEIIIDNSSSEESDGEGSDGDDGGGAYASASTAKRMPVRGGRVAARPAARVAAKASPAASPAATTAQGGWVYNHTSAAWEWSGAAATEEAAKPAAAAAVPAAAAAPATTAQGGWVYNHTSAAWEWSGSADGGGGAAAPSSSVAAPAAPAAAAAPAAQGGWVYNHTSAAWEWQG